MDEAEKKVISTLEAVQEVVSEYIEPGKRDCAETMNKLTEIVDNGSLAEAIDEVKHDVESRTRPSRSAPHLRVVK